MGLTDKRSWPSANSWTTWRTGLPAAGAAVPPRPHPLPPWTPTVRAAAPGRTPRSHGLSRRLCPKAPPPQTSTLPTVAGTFFAGVLGWGCDALADKLVAFVTAGYPSHVKDRVSRSVHSSAKHELLNGAAVASIEHAAVAKTASLLLSYQPWGVPRAAAPAVELFLREAKAAVEADRAAAFPLRLPPPQG